MAAIKMCLGYYYLPLLTSLVLLGLPALAQAMAMRANYEEPYVKLARCRVQCVQKFVPSRMDEDVACWKTPGNLHTFDKDCNSCWSFCDLLANSINYTPCNNPDHCDEGCQSACQFMVSEPKEAAYGGEWHFSDEFTSKVADRELTISWTKPTLRSTGGIEMDVDEKEVGPIVYVLMSRNRNDHSGVWVLFKQILSTSIRIESDAINSTPEFTVLAVTQTGRIADMEFTPKTDVAYDLSEPSGPKIEQLRKEMTSNWYSHEARGATLNVTALDTVVKENADKTRYTTQTADVQFRISTSSPPDVQKAYTLRYIFIDCKTAYNFLRPCEQAPLNRAVTIFAKGNQTTSYRIKDLNFNSIYQVMVDGHGTVAVVVIKTSPCFKADVLRYDQCFDDIPEEERPAVPVKRANDIGMVPSSAQMEVNITSMQLLSIADRTVVQVNLTWSPIANKSVVAYNVTAQLLDGEKKLLVYTVSTPQPYILLDLDKNKKYTVQVEANFKLPNVTAMNNIFWDDIDFNTSDINLAIYQVPQAYHLKEGGGDQRVKGVVIGVTCVMIFVLAMLAALVYKKRNSFKDIIVTKATVAKSNSYKSNVGGKSDYSNQLIVFSDDWELDPLLLKFSSLLGQGAFGKVVTGYYEDQKVAIKLVREGAPLSYKEDLVAEINLMKRIGTHPNIVCLIGACTMADPIALVMEYVPYGNLQNFLKKCRLEGDLHKRIDGPAEIAYSMVQDSGFLENGVVTPADMLSFARQVAMAMEYLTEKKYVHRDLAARNVLIGNDKVVKVCDFGLSRDIFNDNHYKKLTNGKLPLKWMAIESLRDRIFTTQSDVWSFGILLWEIVTMGASPYPNVALADLYYVLSNGYRMDRPSNCSDELYAVMRSCWEDCPLDRPNFTQLRMMMEDLLTVDRNYLVLENIDVPITYSDNSSSPSPPISSDSPLTFGQPGGAIGGKASPVSDVSRHQASDQGTFQRPSSSSSFSSTSTAPSSTQSQPISTANHKSRKASPRRDNLCIKVRVHQKSTDRLIRPSESDSSPSSC